MIVCLVSALFDVELGGDTIIYQHLFWIFGHPEVYILILPLFGTFSDVISNFARNRLLGYTDMAFATIIIAFLGFMVWTHHMFTVGFGSRSELHFSLATMATAVLTVIIFN